MTTALTINEISWDDSQIQLLKSSICNGASDNEFQLFLHACKRTGLDPFMRQIHSVPRGNQRTIQTGIDGLRLIAERTGRYAPGQEATFQYKKEGVILSATSYVKKQTKDGSWHTVSATAFWDEFDGKNTFWKKMPHLMLAKCAECLALRKAFPAEMSGIYAQEEMDQADYEVRNVDIIKTNIISQQQADALNDMIGEDAEYREKFMTFLKNQYKIDSLEKMPAELYERAYNGAKNYQERKVPKEIAI